jgi:hypothetical protein
MAQFLEMRDVGLIPTGQSKAWMYLGLASQMAHCVRRSCSMTKPKNLHCALLDWPSYVLQSILYIIVADTQVDI